MYIIPVVPARGGAEVVLGIYINNFSSIELACAVRQPGLCVRALCEAVAVLLYTACTSTPQYYFVLQSLYKTRSSILLCTTKLAQNTSQYYFVLQSLHKALPSTTAYYKACTLNFPVLLCTTKLAQSTSQYYFVLQSLHK